ncbi:uncharacterized protein LOC111709844 [Eurytemora carolleeae]|uniref:uncharacterized protein LOC111709844 n=1 Tax=Eurytemora carolleeae TaxID=1294199 RepID=UPI000C75898E|nr:uncharacterized protein LOC111709844 [Eurytemora carolleeae]|eukprot:XP_023339530.1 uncharacterized protein LOC111709844 [Eurytemora affinis]
MRKAMAPPPPPRGKFSGSAENISSYRSLVLQFDDIMRRNEVLYESCEDKFSTYVINSGISIRRFKEIERENERLQSQLDKSFQEARILEKKLNQARNLLAEENARTRRAEQEREAISQKFEMVRELLLTDNGNTLNNETRQKLKRLEASVTSLKQGARLVMSPVGKM